MTIKYMWEVGKMNQKFNVKNCMWHRYYEQGRAK